LRPQLKPGFKRLLEGELGTPLREIPEPKWEPLREPLNYNTPRVWNKFLAGRMKKPLKERGRKEGFKRYYL